MFTMLKKKLFKETNDVCDYPQAGRPCSAHTKSVVNAIHAQITRNPCRQKILSQEMNLVPRTILRVLAEDLGP